LGGGEMKKIKILHLYPDAMNLYGDFGNILTLIKRCQWRDISVELLEQKIGDKQNLNDIDILFLGGGQDRGQQIISKDLIENGKYIKEAVEKGTCALTVCGGYQLFGRYFKTSGGTEIPGINIFNAWTEAGQKRMIGNVLVDCRKTTSHWGNMHKFDLMEKMHAMLVGFENHSGKTHLDPTAMPLGHIIKGYGNNLTGKLEGCQYKNAFGTYLHGSLLPKNPWFADHLILLGLKRRYGSDIQILPLNDSIELRAHEVAKKRVYSGKTLHI
jgi:lipid II isoglutaminyl synthase (glutamine-hydrolysing)